MATSPWILDSEWLPRLETATPTTIYVNGRQIPPIEGIGEIIRFTLGGMQIVSNSMIPIPSAGKIRFSLGHDYEEIELTVDFVQRIELSRSLLPWKVKPKFQMEAAIGPNGRDTVEKYQFFLHRQLFGKGSPGVSMVLRNKEHNL